MYSIHSSRLFLIMNMFEGRLWIKDNSVQHSQGELFKNVIVDLNTLNTFILFSALSNFISFWIVEILKEFRELYLWKIFYHYIDLVIQNANMINYVYICLTSCNLDEKQRFLLWIVFWSCCHNQSSSIDANTVFSFDYN